MQINYGRLRLLSFNDSWVEGNQEAGNLGKDVQKDKGSLRNH